MERFQEKYLRWLLRVERHTRGCLIREELQREKLKDRAGMRAWGYKRKLEKGKGEILAR